MDIAGLSIPFVQAKHFTHGNRTRGDIDWIVIHDMEMYEKPDTAEACANYFAATTREASAHYCVDNNSIVQCVNLEDIAWAAPGGNSRGVQIELAGFARQSTGEWLDPYGRAMLSRTAVLVSALASHYGIPKRQLNVDDLIAGRRGITSHWNISTAFKRSTHTDPGPNFPWSYFMELVLREGTPVKPVDPTTPSGLVRVDGKSFWTFFPKWVTIRRGSRFYAETIALQYALNGYTTATGRQRLALDGVYGSATEGFVEAFQHWKGLSKDGVAGPNTAKALRITR